MQIKELKVLLENYEQNYYNDKQALVEDEEYNALVKKYLEMTGQEEYDFVPGKIITDNRVKHPYPVISLAKVKITEIEKLKKEIHRLWPICIQWKLDGATLMFYWDKENRYKIVTRGDGEYGEDKTDYASFISNKGNPPTNNGVRCEAVIKRKDFNAINNKMIVEGKEPFKNARNALSGMLNRKIDLKDKATFPEGISVIAYNTVNDTAGRKETLELLEHLGWETVNTFYPKNEDEALDYILNFNFYDESIDIDIDGLVIKNIEKKDFGMTGHHPLNAFAVKPETPELWTRLRDIEWNVGKTGLITPTAVFDPIDILGSTVERATLHNSSYIDALGLNFIYCDMYHRTYVKVTKANMIIPAVLDSKHEFDKGYSTKDGYIKSTFAPNRCPACGSQVKKINDQIFCTNDWCKEKLIAQAMNMVSRNGLDITGLSEETIRKMYNLTLKWCNENETSENSSYALIYPTFCLGWTKEKLLAIEGFADKLAENLLKEYQNKLVNVPFSKFLYACNIPLVGKTAAKLIAKNFRDIDELCQDIKLNNGKKLLSINGIGKELYKNISSKNGLTMLNVIYKSINGSIQYEYAEQKQIKDQKIFVITGTLSQPRNYFQELIEKAGGKVSGSVSKKTDYVLAGENAGSKLDKAKDLNIKIISENELEKILNDL